MKLSRIVSQRTKSVKIVLPGIFTMAQFTHRPLPHQRPQAQLQLGAPRANILDGGDAWTRPRQ